VSDRFGAIRWGGLGTGENLRDVVLFPLLKRDYCWMYGADEVAVHSFSIFARDRNGVTSLRSSFQAVTDHYGIRALYNALYFGCLRTVREKKRRVGLGQQGGRSQKKDCTQIWVHAVLIQRDTGEGGNWPMV
jgi:hypothetical protein